MAKDKTPDEIEASLRKSAERFGADLQAARDAGFEVAWPGRPEDLAAIEISATAAVNYDVAEGAGNATAPKAGTTSGAPSGGGIATKA